MILGAGYLMIPLGLGVLTALALALLSLWMIVAALRGNRDASWAAGVAGFLGSTAAAVYLGWIFGRLVRATVSAFVSRKRTVVTVPAVITNDPADAPALVRARRQAFALAQDAARALVRGEASPDVEPTAHGARFDVRLDGVPARVETMLAGWSRVRIRITLDLEGADVHFAVRGRAGRAMHIDAASELVRDVLDAPVRTALAVMDGLAGPWGVEATRAGLTIDRVVRVRKAPAALPPLEVDALAAAALALQRRILAHLADAARTGIVAGAFRDAARIEAVDPRADDAVDADEKAVGHDEEGATPARRT